MVSTHLKNISQIGLFPQIGVKIKNKWNHHPASCTYLEDPDTDNIPISNKAWNASQPVQDHVLLSINSSYYKFPEMDQFADFGDLRLQTCWTNMD